MRGLLDQVDRGKQIASEGLQKARRKLSRRYMDYSRTFGTEEGRRVLADLCKTAGAYDAGFVQGDALAMAYKAGARDFALQCLNLSGQGKLDIERRIRELDDE